MHLPYGIMQYLVFFLNSIFCIVFRIFFCDFALLLDHRLALNTRIITLLLTDFSLKPMIFVPFDCKTLENYKTELFIK